MHYPVLLLTLLTALLTTTQAQTNIQQGCVAAGTFNPTTDYFPEKATIASGSNIKIEYFNYYKVVTVTESATKQQKYVLVQCGTQDAPPGVTTGATGVIQVPITKLGAEDTTPLTFIELLGVRDTLQFAPDLAVSPCIQQKDLPVMASYFTDPTKLAQQRATLDLTLTTQDPVPQDIRNVARFTASSDRGKLHRSQWLHFLAAFYNKEAWANTLTKQIAEQYNCVADAAASTATTLGSPSVTWGNNYQGTWYLGSQYQWDYSADAGGVPSTGVTPSAMFDMSKTDQSTLFSTLLKNTDMILDTSLYGSQPLQAFYNATGLNDSVRLQYNFTRTGFVWSVHRELNSLKTGSAWFEQAVPLEHIVLADLAYAIQPSLFPNYTPRFLLDIDQNKETVQRTASECKDTVAAQPSPLPTITCPTAASVNAASAGQGWIDWAGDGPATVNAALAACGGKALAFGATVAMAAALVL